MMAQVFSQRMMAEIDGDFVVFLIGMRVNKPWKIHKWLPVALAMGPMVKELEADPSSGFLGSQNFLGAMVQYWRSFEDLERYARGRGGRHWPAWQAFNRRSGQSRGDVGIWHETYQVRAGHYEAIYSGMPAFGLGKAGRLAPASGARESARGRLATTR
jgi:hypothetical protein